MSISQTEIEKFKLELELRDFLFQCKEYNNKYYARIVNKEYVDYAADQLRNRDGRWKYFAWGETEHDAICEVYKKWQQRITDDK